MTVLLTGGSGFIGCNFIADWIQSQSEPLVNIDKMTYAGNPAFQQIVPLSENHHLVQGDINDSELVESVLEKHKPRAVIHFAAETHVDRSIVSPESFIRTNVVGTFNLMETTRCYLSKIPEAAEGFKFIHVSTDEVYGSLASSDRAFTEKSSYHPSSPYSASKAASDHLARAWFHTYKFPTIVTNCTNNYGPWQNEEKMIPTIINTALSGQKIPIYGDGSQIRDWLFVSDHCSALMEILARGKAGETYAIGAQNEIENLTLARTICRILDDIAPAENKRPYESRIEFVQDRPGHDQRYAIDPTKIREQLGWRPSWSMDRGLYESVMWYVQRRSG